MQWFKELPDNIAYWLGFALGYIIAWCITLPEKAQEAGKAFLENVISEADYEYLLDLNQVNSLVTVHW